MGTVKYSGPVASFHCPTEATIRSLKVHFSPKQLGEGTPSPENVREIEGWEEVSSSISGTNIADTSVFMLNKSISWGGQRETYGNFTTTNYHASFLFHIPQGATLTLTCHNSDVYWVDRIIPVKYDSVDWNSGFFGYYNYALYGNVTSRLTTRTWTMPEEADGLLVRFRMVEDIAITQELFNNLKMSCVVGSAAPEVYEPYHGETVDYEFGVLGKNKFPAADGTTSDIFLAANTTYTLSNTSASEGYFKGWYEDGTNTGLIWINAGSDGNRYWKTFTPQKNIIKGLMYVGTGMSECQIELGSSATTYEPYDPNKTVYGGWVDLISGEVCEERVLETFTTTGRTTLSRGYDTTDDSIYFGIAATYPYIAEYSKGTIVISPSTGVGIIPRNGLCNWLNIQYVDNWCGTQYVNSLCASYNPTSFSIRVASDLMGVESTDTETEKATKVNAYLAEHPLQVAYELVTPNTYSLTPTQMQTFLAQNNVWSNADYVEVEYDLHETQNILARKQFIMANQPHVVKPAAAPLQNFVTDMAAPLKECKVYFSPVQDTSNGAPSPDNICPISGWTGIEVEQRNKNLLGNYENGYFRTFIPAETRLVASANIPTSGNNQVRFYRADKTEIDYWTLTENYMDNRRKRSFTPHEDCYYWKFINNNFNVQLELGTTATAYEPYSGTTLSLDWTDSAGTIYGGYVDLVTGVLVQEWARYICDGSETWTYIQDVTGGKEFASAYGKVKTPYSQSQYQLCTHLIFDGGSYKIAGKFGLGYSGRIYVSVPTSIGETAEEWAAYLKEQYDNNTPLTFYYRLGKSDSYSLTPTTLKTLRGTNNIWSNAGNITLSYWKH